MDTIKKILTLMILSVVISLYGCQDKGKNAKDSDDSNESHENINKPQPINLSVYIDLSDRLIREMTPSHPNQMERDTAIINHLLDIFIDDCIKNGKIILSDNHFQIFFYPAPNSSQIAQLADDLNIDMSKIDAKEKKSVLMSLKTRVQKNLTQIYNTASADNKWVGSDIWGFFSNKAIDKLCIRNGYRNILVILTDGYLYHKDNKINEGNAYSYILPKTLSISNSSLICRRKGLDNLEVLMLEVNPYTSQQRDVLIPVLEEWFKNMEVKNFMVTETDLPVNTKVYIDSFMSE